MTHYSFHRDKTVDADGQPIGWLSRLPGSTPRYFLRTPGGRVDETYGVSRPVAAARLRTLAEQEGSPDA